MGHIGFKHSCIKENTFGHPEAKVFFKSNGRNSIGMHTFYQIFNNYLVHYSSEQNRMWGFRDVSKSRGTCFCTYASKVVKLILMHWYNLIILLDPILSLIELAFFLNTCLRNRTYALAWEVPLRLLNHKISKNFIKSIIR